LLYRIHIIEPESKTLLVSKAKNKYNASTTYRGKSISRNRPEGNTQFTDSDTSDIVKAPKKGQRSHIANIRNLKEKKEEFEEAKDNMSDRGRNLTPVKREDKKGSRAPSGHKIKELIAEKKEKEKKEQIEKEKRRIERDKVSL